MYARLRSATALSLVALACVLAASVLPGCGDDDVTPPPVLAEPQYAVGQFHDRVVGGLACQSGDSLSITSDDGRFIYLVGGTARFAIGDIELGSGAADSIMTPVELVAGAEDEIDPAVTNITRFLLTLDDDADPETGIAITAAVRAAAGGRAIDFDQPAEAFAADPEAADAVTALTALTAAGVRELVTTEAARAHLRATLLGLLAGDYAGSYVGVYGTRVVDYGTWTAVADSSGAVVADVSSPLLGDIRLTGTMESDGTWLLATGAAGVTFTGRATRTGQVSGSWQIPGSAITGSFSGRRVGR